MFKLLNGESKTIFGAAAIVGVLSFVSRVVGFVRDRMLAGQFGAGDTLDVYYAAFRLPDLLFTLIVVGSLSASFIPLFTKYYNNTLTRPKAWDLTNNLLHLICTAMFVLSVGLFLFADPLAALIAPGFDDAKQALVADYTRVMLLAQVILAASVVFGSVLQGMKRFVLYSLAPVFYNIGIIAGAWWLVPVIGPIGLAWGVVLGALLHLSVQVYGVLTAGYRYRPVWRLRDRDSREILLLMGPRMLGNAVSQVNFVVFTVIASLLGIGAVTIFQFAYNIQFFAVGIIGVSYAIAAFPSFSEHLERQDSEGFVRIFSLTVRQVLFFMIPLMLAFLVLRAQIVRVVVGAGAFDWEATIATADTLAFFSLSFVAQSLVYVFSRAFFALRDTVTPLAAGLVAALFGLVIALWLSPHFGVVALGMAYSAAAIVNLVLLWVPLRQRMGSLDEQRVVRSLLILSSAGLVCGVTIQLLKPLFASLLPLTSFFAVFAQGLLAGGIGIAAYLVICHLLGSEELKDVIAGLHKRVLRKSNPEEPVPVDTSTTS